MVIRKIVILKVFLCTLIGTKYASAEYFQVDTLKQDSLKKIVITNFKAKGRVDTLDISKTRNVPNVSLQQALKGNIAGLFVQEATGEPGSEQSMIIQGASAPIFTKKDVATLQPAVYVNGVLLTQDNAFAYDVQRYDFNRIGPATNLLANIDIDNIQSVELLKDPIALAKLGPNATNGAIWIILKPAKSGLREISLNAFSGIIPQKSVTSVNAVVEREFRRPFYEKFATPDNYKNYASFLRDSTNQDYYGKSNWNDLYYQNAAIYGANIGITGGSDRANFRFFGTGSKNANSADATGLNKYNLFFNLNMLPFEWLTVSSFLNASRMDRSRNRSLRDRFAEVRYLPDLSNPLSPNKQNYQLFLDEYDKVVDDNRNNLINGSLSIGVKLKDKLTFNSSVVFDYNEGIRNAFFPTTLIDGVNYVSDYFGYNQRFGLNNSLNYDYKLDDKNLFDFEVGHLLQNDVYKYNYSRGYDGNSDFIKINVVVGDAKKSNYLNAINNFYLFRYTDRIENKMGGFYGSVKYSYADLLKINAVVRRDGSSFGPPNRRWKTTPAVNAELNLKRQFSISDKLFDQLSLSAGWSQSVKLFADDRYAAGAQYRTEYGWLEEPTIPTYAGFIGLSRPYNSGWVGYDITLPFTNRLNVALNASMFNKKLDAAINFYKRDDKNQVLNIPTTAESGYATVRKNGMDVANTGLDLVLGLDVLQNPKSFSWYTNINFNVNKNELKALPNGLNELIIGEHKIKVGQPVGVYWLYENGGVYNNKAEVPQNPANGKAMTFKGIELGAGDPRWADVNGDFTIDENDKKFIGNRLPKLIGGWNNTFNYGNFELNFHLFFALGQKTINQFDANRYDFVNKESANDINSIKEITFWQNTSNAKSYPIYNVWSNVIPYRADQDIFLEDASYMKLRSVTLGYDLSKSKFAERAKLGFRRAYVYVTGSNLFTVTKFSGVDPELTNYNGIYDGTSLPIPRTFTLGLKLEL